MTQIRPGKKVFPHPLLFIALLLLLFARKTNVLIGATLSLVLHEGAHLLAARARGFVPERFSLTPFGATLSFDSGLTSSDEFFVAVAGPAVNLLFCPLLVTLWWFFPSFYAFTSSLFRANFFLALFNLLPLYPFDGGRMLSSLSKAKVRMRKMQRGFGGGVGALLTASGVFAVFKGFGFTLLLAGCLLLWYALFPSENDRFRLVFDQMDLFRSNVPLEQKHLFVDRNTSLKILLRRINSRKCYYVVHVTENGKEVFALSGENLNVLFFKNRKLSVGDAYLQYDSST